MGSTDTLNLAVRIQEDATPDSIGENLYHPVLAIPFVGDFGGDFLEAVSDAVEEMFLVVVDKETGETKATKVFGLGSPCLKLTKGQAVGRKEKDTRKKMFFNVRPTAILVGTTILAEEKDCKFPMTRETPDRLLAESVVEPVHSYEEWIRFYVDPKETLSLGGVGLVQLRTRLEVKAPKQPDVGAWKVIHPNGSIVVAFEGNWVIFGT